VNEWDAQMSTEDLLDEYSGIVMLTSRPEHALRVNEIIEELRRRGAFDGSPLKGPKRKTP
jgi:hypothetical protein